MTKSKQCSDIIFVEPGDSRLPPLNDSICFNTTELGFGDLYTITTKKPVFLNGTKSSSALRQVDSSSALRLLAGLVPAVVGGLSLFL
jgi:hypothetical protein